MPFGHFFRSVRIFAPPPQPQSSTFASGASFKNRRPQPAQRAVPHVHHQNHQLPAKTGRLAGVFKKGHIKASSDVFQHDDLV